MRMKDKVERKYGENNNNKAKMNILFEQRRSGTKVVKPIDVQCVVEDNKTVFYLNQAKGLDNVNQVVTINDIEGLYKLAKIMERNVRRSTSEGFFKSLKSYLKKHRII